MPTDLLGEIRDYAEWLDASAPPAQDLAPDTVEPTTRRQVPAWTRAVVALAAVLAVGIPLALLFDGFGPEVDPTDTITASPEDGPVVLVADNGTMVLGKDHPPGAGVTVRLDGALIGDGVVGPSTSVGSDGRFEIVLWPDLGLVDGETATVTVDDPEEGTTTYTVTQVGVDFDRLDPAVDVAVGRAFVPDGTTVIVRIESGTDLTVAETTTFNGAWEVDLSDTVDVTLESVGTAWVESGDGYAASGSRSAIPDTPHLSLVMGNWFLEGTGWEPGATAGITVNGEPLAAPITVGAGGRFEVFLDQVGLGSGDVIEVDDGTRVRSLTVHDLALDAHDPSTGTVSGRTDLPDGSIVLVGHRASPPIEAVVGDGRFTAVFDTGPLAEFDVGWLDDDGDWLGGVDAVIVDASGSTPLPDSPAEEGVVVFADGELEVAGFGLRPGDAVGVEIVSEGEVAFDASDAASVGSDGSFRVVFDDVVHADGEARVRVGAASYVIPVAAVNLVRIFDESDQLGVEVDAPAGKEAVAWVTTGGERIGIPVRTTGLPLAIDVPAPGLDSSSSVEVWLESGDGWVMNRGQTGAPQVEYFASDGRLYASWLDPAEAVEVAVDGEAIGMITADELGRAEVFTSLESGSTVTLSNDRISVDLGPLPAIAVEGIDGVAVFGTAEVPDGTSLVVEIRSGALGEGIDATVFDGEWRVETDLEGPDRSIEVRWQDPSGDQYVLWWDEE